MRVASYAIHADETLRQFLSAMTRVRFTSDEQEDAIRAFVTATKITVKQQAVGQAILDGKTSALTPNLYIWATMKHQRPVLFPMTPLSSVAGTGVYAYRVQPHGQENSGKPIDFSRLAITLFMGHYLSISTANIHAYRIFGQADGLFLCQGH